MERSKLEETTPPPTPPPQKKKRLTPKPHPAHARSTVGLFLLLIPPVSPVIP